MPVKSETALRATAAEFDPQQSCLLNGMQSFQLFVVVFYICLVWEMLILPSDAIATTKFSL